MKLFDKLYTMGAETVKALNKGPQQRMLKRAFEAVADKAGNVTDKTDKEIAEYQLKLVSAPDQRSAEDIITSIIEKRLEAKAARAVSAEVPAEATLFFEVEQAEATE
jgi:hypothetical protein